MRFWHDLRSDSSVNGVAENAGRRLALCKAKVCAGCQPVCTPSPGAPAPVHYLPSPVRLDQPQAAGSVPAQLLITVQDSWLMTAGAVHRFNHCYSQQPFSPPIQHLLSTLGTGLSLNDNFEP